MHRYLARFFLLFALAFACVACSHQEVLQPTAQKRVMPDNYSRIAIDTLSEIAPYFPDQTSIAVFSSYGSITETFQAFEQWNLVDAESLKKTLTDLGTHYKLDPSKLKSFYEAGMHTGKGFGIGMMGRSVIAVMHTLEPKSVVQWLDNLVTEEFGRPDSTDSKADGWVMHHVKVMDKDRVTLLQKNDISIMVWSDDSLKTSKEVLASLAAGNTLASILNMADLKRNFRTSSILAVASGKAALPKELLVTPLADWAKSLYAGVTLEKNRIGLMAAMDLNAENTTVATIQSFEGGDLSPWSKAIMHTDPGVAVRVKVSPQTLTGMVLKNLPARYLNQWKDISSKLNNRLFGINLEEQIVNNFAGSIWVSLHGMDSAGFEPDVWSALQKLDVSLYLPMADASLAGKFFGKMSFLQKFIPADVATVETDQGVLHAIVRVKKDTPLHVSYADGLLAVTTDRGWARMKQLYAAPNQNDGVSLAMTDNANDIAGYGKMALAADLAWALFQRTGADAQEYINLARRLESFDFRVILNGNTFVAEVNAERAEK